jgi:hypothetical protein
MPTSERRVAALEKLIPLRCSTCGHEVRCDHCNDWKAEARALGIDPEVLVDRFRREMEVQLLG